MAGLRLEVQDFADLTRWRWALLDEATGALLLDHEVRLDTGNWQFQAFGDLTGYLSWHVTPDRRREDEARIVGEVGAWIGSEMLGPIAGALARNGPVTVRVVVPEAAEALLFRPLELAHAGSRPLSVQDVTFVMQAGWEAEAVLPVGERLRVLGLFSLPEGGRSLNLRRERHSLVRLIQGIAATGKSVDVRVMQYGVTRERLRDVLEEAEGWDIIHISGHGTPGELLLETAAGRQDRLTATELAGLLDPARERVKLVTVAACWSAAVTVAEQRRLLGLPAPGGRAQDDDLERSRHPADGGSASGAMATQLASRLGCAVLAMRFPVGDEFAMALTGKMYDLLARQGQPLPRAVGMTLRQLLAGTRYPALYAATPALFGGRAMDLRLAAPDRDQPENSDTAAPKMAGFPPQPERFVGRTGVMARASAALAARSGIPGVLLYGMPGGGKTACALELAYGQEHAFDQLIWYKAPDDGVDITGALTDFALTLEQYLDGFQMAHVLVDDDHLTAFLPRLTEEMAQHRLLLVIDNAESLITGDGHWHDERWGQVIGALCGHAGPGRLILTSRRVPAGTTALRMEAVEALSADEALLLASQLPHLSALKLGQASGIDRLAGRQLARRALEIAQGHPKLLELAEGQAAHPERLAGLLDAGDRAWRRQGGVPAGFFAAGEGTASGEDYLHVLAAWTRAVTEALAPGERDLFWFLCCLEERDRQRSVLDGNWAGLWNRLGRDGQPFGPGQALATLAAQGLAAIRAGTDDAAGSYAVHPWVAAAGRAQAGKPFQDAVDAEAAAFWDTGYRHASGQAGDGGVDTGRLVRAGLAAVPYLIRQQQWAHAAALLERAFVEDPSRANAAAMLPAIQQAARHDPGRAATLALVLRVLDLAAAETVMRDSLDAAVTAGDYRTASAIAGRLVLLCRDTGRLADALDLADQTVGYTRQAGLGPWTQLADDGRRLQVLTAMGQAGRVLAEVTRLRDHMAILPATLGPDEAVIPWNAREALLDTGRDAARQLGRWADALDLNAAQAASQRDRNAPATDIARTRFSDYYPLLRLGRTGQALALLQDCLRTFQDAHHTTMIGNILGALSDVEDQRGHGEAALRLVRDALRYKYLADDVTDIAVGYHCYGDYLRRHARQPAPALASHLAAALIRTLIGIGGDNAGSAWDSMQRAATDLRELGTAAVPPADVADLDRQLGHIPGTDLPGLIQRLCPDAARAQQAFHDLVAQAQALAVGRSATASAKRRRWPWRGGTARSG